MGKARLTEKVERAFLEAVKRNETIVEPVAKC